MRHKITQGNITDLQINKNIEANYPNGIDFCYTDPPWGSGNLKWWKTLNKKATNVDAELIDQEILEERIVELITTYVNNYAFIVYGVHQAESIIHKLKQKSNVKDIQYYEKTYQSTKAMVNCVICVTLNDASIKDFSVLEGLKGLKGLRYVCELFKDEYESVLELFVGIGHYLKIFHKYNFNVIGNELNSSRLDKAISKIK